MAAGIAETLETWNSFYANHPILRAGLAFTHVGGLVLGGGSAVMLDRLTLRAGAEPGARAGMLRLLSGSHVTVVSSLAAMTLSGVLMAAADFDTFVHSKLFWAKMALFILLLANGALLVKAERRATASLEHGWPLMRAAASISLLLWALTTMLGAALPNFG